MIVSDNHPPIPMSSFADLKEDRRARQRSLASSSGGMDIDHGEAAGDEVEVVLEPSALEEAKVQGVVGKTIQSNTGYPDLRPTSTQNEDDTTRIDAEAGPSTSQIVPSAIVNPSSLPRYNDFPPTLEVRQSSTTGRGFHLKVGQTIRKGERCVSPRMYCKLT